MFLFIEKNGEIARCGQVARVLVDTLAYVYWVDGGSITIDAQDGKALAQAWKQHLRGPAAGQPFIYTLRVR